MSKRQETARYTLPIDVNPPTSVCFQIDVPNDIYHIGAFLGQIYALGRAYSWANDSAHTAKLAAAVWMDIFDNLKRCEPTEGNSGADEGIEQMIRQNPANPCELQTSINGTDWCTFADLSKCIPGSQQPGSGTPQPKPGGGQQCYHAVLDGAGQWLLPYQVNSGDVIAVSAVNGAWNDGSGTWRCPNGQIFFLGACTGSATTSGSDPLPSVGHARLVYAVGSTFHDGYNTSLTIGAGVTNANVVFQMNDPSLSDNFGQVTFDVCVTNNASATWTHTFDFKANDGGFIIDTYGAGWTPSVGWVSALASGNDDIRIRRACPAGTVITSFDLQITRTGGNVSAGDYMYSKLDTSDQWGNGTVTPNATFHTVWSGTQTISSDAIIGAFCQAQHQAAGNQEVIEKIVLTGLGIDPF